MDELYDPGRVARQIASAGSLKIKGVENAIKLLDEGNTLPFIARYRKEATLGLDETELRFVEDALSKAKELAARKRTILKTIEQQGALTDALRKKIFDCEDRVLLEDLYLPFKPKRRTKATIAREKGLEPLAKILYHQTPIGRSQNSILADYVDAQKEVATREEALEGAGHIVSEWWSEDAGLRKWLLSEASGGRVVSKVKRGKKEVGEKFEMYFDFSEPIRRIASHRMLAIKRGEHEGILRVAIELNEESILRYLKRELVTCREFEFFHFLLTLVETTYRSHFLPAVSSSVLRKLKEDADGEAIRVFASNLRELMLAAPAGKRVTNGIDPGFRTGCKVAVVDGTGKYLASKTIFPTPPRSDLDGAGLAVLELIKKYDVELIAIGNGTASRETDAFVAGLIKSNDLKVTKVMVNEAGASIYSASPLAVQEYPDLDVTIRGAISIAHRLQDPLAELVKIEAKSIGVGQYQHDVNQPQLKTALDREVESCVNSVGVELNTASGPLLGYVAGVGEKLAQQIVAYRNEQGRFQSRKELLKVPKLGKKVFEQAAGFLRISSGNEPLDDSAVHPECYYLVEKMSRSLNVKTKQLVGNASLAAKLDAADFVDDRFGLPTVSDILSEISKPGRDPRKEFQAVKFDDAVNEIGDLNEGMILQGQVTNVTNFGAFVDIGVHQDGLVHISEIADRYIGDPSEVVAVGDLVRVKVVQVEPARKRIALSMKQA